MNDKLNKIILISLILTILGYCYYYFYLADEIVKISKTREATIAQKAVVKELLAKRNTVDDEILKAKADTHQLQTQFPDVYDKKEMILHFYNLIKDSGVKTDNISFSDVIKDEQKYRVCSVSFKVEADNAAIMKFIRTIENDQRKFVIKQANIGPGEQGASLSILIEFYSLK